MSENRIGQWFVDARNPTYWYGPVVALVKGVWHGEQYCTGAAPFDIDEDWIAEGRFLRIPPKPGLPAGLVTCECRLPRKGERFVNLVGGITRASIDWAALDGDDFGFRRWIVEDDPDAKPALQVCEMADKIKELEPEIDRLTRELAKARAEKEKEQ